VQHAIDIVKDPQFVGQTPLTPFRGRGVGGEGARAMREERWMARGGD
jgi:hypothetical protein